MTQARAAFGITVELEGVAVAEVLEVPEIPFKKEFIDVTNHGSPGGFEESIPKAIIRSGELTLRCNSINGDAGQIAVKAAWDSGNAGTLAITFPDGEAISGEAYVTGYSYIGALEDQIIFTMTIKWTGEVTDVSTLATAPTDLTITTATLTPAFSGTVYDYVATSVTNSGTLTLTFATSKAKLYRNGVYVQELTTGEASGSLSFGNDGDVTDLAVVVSEAGKGSRTYNIRVANAAA